MLLLSRAALYTFEMRYWWVWILLLPVGIIAAKCFWREDWRETARRELTDYIRQNAPEFEVHDVTPTTLTLKFNGNTGQFNLDNLYERIEPVASDPQDRKDVYSFILDILRQMHETKRPLSFEADRNSIFPRLQPLEFLTEVPGGSDIPFLPLENTGLIVTFVRYTKHAGMYLTQENLNQLGIDEHEAMKLALENLRKRTGADMVRPVLDEQSPMLINVRDGYDSARLLLVPEFLKKGETVAAVVPDRDTFLLAPVPDDWSALKQICETSTSRYPLTPFPIKVTSAGFEVVRD